MTRGGALRVGAVALASGALLLWSCRRLPSLAGRVPSTALLYTADTALGRRVGARVAAHPGKSGIQPLFDSRDAFAARVLLARAAERTLDAQYYIWHEDLSGTLMLEALREAAGRGVRVRLLLDDANTSGLDPTLSAIDSHPNVEVRLFNPFVTRRSRTVGYLTDFSRLDRRMHNKSFTADSQATVVGGRNVGDEYFGAGDGSLFVDLDVLAVGPVVLEVSTAFDRYWNSESAYPASLLLPKAKDGALAGLASEAARVAREPASAAYVAAVRDCPFVRDLLAGELPLEWVGARVYADDPAKALGRAAPEALLSSKLRTVIGRPRHDVHVVSPYFVPRKGGTELLREWVARGVAVRVLTNSLEATDVASVHAGYSKRRRALLEGGVALWELRRAAGRTYPHDAPGGSGSALHAKTFAVDGERLFVGSMNLDPRSASLNTEMGFVLESPALATKLAALFEGAVPRTAYEVRLSETGDLVWIERRGAETVRHDHEPGAGFWRRAGVAVLSLLPIEPLL